MSETADAAELRDRMGRYVAAELPTHGDLLRIDWPLEVHWDERRLQASIRRGELVLSARTYLALWWQPPKRGAARRWMDHLASLLGKLHEQYADVDETGRLHLFAWREAGGMLTLAEVEGAEAVELVLEPGVRPGSVGGGSLPRLHRLGSGRGLSIEEAITEGWATWPSDSGANVDNTARGR